METVERKAPKTTHFWNKKAPKALESSTFGAFEQLVRMRSAVQIRPAAPEIHLKSSDFGCFLLLLETFWANTILRIFVDHIEYHRQNEAVFPMPCREHRFSSSLRGSCRSLELLSLGGDLRFHLNDQV